MDAFDHLVDCIGPSLPFPRPLQSPPRILYAVQHDGSELPFAGDSLELGLFLAVKWSDGKMDGPSAHLSRANEDLKVIVFLLLGRMTERNRLDTLQGQLAAAIKDMKASDVNPNSVTELFEAVLRMDDTPLGDRALLAFCRGLTSRPELLEETSLAPRALELLLASKTGSWSGNGPSILLHRDLIAHLVNAADGGSTGKNSGIYLVPHWWDTVTTYPLAGESRCTGCASQDDGPAGQPPGRSPGALPPPCV